MKNKDTFQSKRKEINEFFEKYPQSMRQFVKDVILHNAINHPDRGRLMQIPAFDDIFEESSEITGQKEEIKENISKINTETLNNFLNM